MDMEKRCFTAHWHPISDPPKEEGEYLVARQFMFDPERHAIDIMPFGKIGRGKKAKYTWYMYGEALNRIDCSDEVVAWMELPEYREEK